MNTMDDMKDKKIEEVLLKGTDEAVELKDMVWKNIENRLNLEERKVIPIKRRSFLKYGIVAAVLVIILLANTRYGSAAADKIRKLFVPNKTIEQNLEGTGEKTKVDLEISPMKYIIYLDKEMYKMDNIDGKDVITPKNVAQNLPEVSMTIEQVLDKKPEDLSAEIEKALKKDFKIVNNRGKVTEPTNAILIQAQGGNKWNDKVIKYYLIDNTKGGTFVIKQQYFVEASEGHGARFDNIVKEFKIVN